MPTETLNCPMCGAAAATDAPRCAHCGARLATVACPGCFGLMFLGQEFCPHCGAKANRQELDAKEKPQLCPRCRAEMTAVLIGGTKVRECPRCEGIWTDTDSLRQICDDREKQAAALGMANPSATGSEFKMEEHIRYLPCPVCDKLMNRVNFANFSSVIVDVCRAHGTWFDCDELRRVVEFIRAGGLDKARAREIAELEAERSHPHAVEPMMDMPPWRGADIRSHGIWAIAEFLIALLK